MVSSSTFWSGVLTNAGKAVVGRDLNHTKMPIAAIIATPVNPTSVRRRGRGGG
jgi:hypothetical protein